MTSTPPPPAKQHRYAISDERLAQLYSATAQQDCEMLMFHRDDVLGLLDRLDAAEARLAQATRFKPDPECTLCKGFGRVEYWCHDDLHHRDCDCTFPSYVKGGGK